MAEVEAMYSDAGTGKGWYFGYSQGTVQMNVALTKYETELSAYLNRVVFSHHAKLNTTMMEKL